MFNTTHNKKITDGIALRFMYPEIGRGGGCRQSEKMIADGNMAFMD